ncbi:hypothetical protein CAEBREN_08847 [Caenorhabditis brenneri]|uniref:Uncharacterized protein n=1 Tax=Caenorhabditis brenneri TaxID=135651 RepID=G0MU79_CAEBE|nr:hypothetical protein CAEBREN_08847 [Caenorhabditis brenneri]
MKSIKWYLLNLHVWIMILDYSVGLLTIPIILLPRFAMFPMGILRVFGVPTMVQFLMVLTVLGYVMISIVAIFENRFYTICTFPHKSLYSKWRRSWILAHYFCVVLVIILFGYMSPDQAASRKHIFESLPCLQNYIAKAPLYILCEDYTYHLILLVFFTTLASCEVLVFVGFLIWNSLQQLKTKRMSQRTFKMQKKFFITLIIQIEVPMVMLLIPFGYEWYTILFNYYNQEYNNIAIMTESLHGFVSTIVTIFVHRPYRKALLAMLTRQFGISRDEKNCKEFHCQTTIVPIHLY